MSDQLKLYDDNDDAERSKTREQIHAEVCNWFPTAESLVQQLGADARRLAQSYPAPNTTALLAQMLREGAGSANDSLAATTFSIAVIDDDPSSGYTAAHSTSRRIAWPIPQAAAAALLLVAAWSVWQWSADKPPAPGRDPQRQFAEQPRNPTVIPVAIPHAPLEPQEFQTLSAPEREAVLDLLEEQAIGTVSLSI